MVGGGEAGVIFTAGLEWIDIVVFLSWLMLGKRFGSARIELGKEDIKYRLLLLGVAELSPHNNLPA